MSSASAPPHGFVPVRGLERGYRPEQVEACAEALSQERDAAWVRAARLTVLAREMGTELERLREVVAGLAPQRYEALGEGARRLFRLGEEEAAAVRERARRDAEGLVEEARAYATGVHESAQAHADAVRAEADEWARQRLLAARAEADEVRIAARREVRVGRAEALAAVREVRRRTAVLDEQNREYAERWAEAEQAEAERVKALDAHHAELVARAEEGCARRSGPWRTPRWRTGDGRKRPGPGRPRSSPRPGCARSGSPRRRSGCCANTGTAGTTCTPTWPPRATASGR